jgi:signal transduction histidine kinase/DNA-binding response OmpR family regulator
MFFKTNFYKYAMTAITRCTGLLYNLLNENTARWRLVFIICISLLAFPYATHATISKQQKLDSLLGVYNNGRYDGRNDTSKVRLLLEITTCFPLISKDSAIVLCNSALKLSRRLNYMSGEGLSLLSIGRALYETELDKALEYCLKALDIFEKTGNIAHMALAENTIAGLLFNLDQFTEALNHFRVAKENYKLLGANEGVANANHSIGASLLNLHQFDSALYYELLALKYFEKSGNLQKVASTNSNIANDYLELKEYSKAMMYSSKALRLFRSAHLDNYGFEIALSERGYIHYRIATDPAEKILPDSLLIIGRESNLKKAIEFYNEAYEIHKKGQSNSPSILLRLSESYIELGKYKEALHSFKLYTSIKDSFFSNNTQLKITAQELKREAALKEKQIALYKIQELQKRNERIFYAVSLALVILTSVLIIQNYLRQKKLNKRLETAIDTLGIEKEKLEAAYIALESEKIKSDTLSAELTESLAIKNNLTAQLEQSAAMKSKFLENISHELRTPVTLLTGMLEMIQENKSGGLNDQARKKLSVAYHNSKRLQQMIAEILDLSKLDYDGQRSIAKQMEILPLLRRQVYAFETLLQKEGLELIFEETQMAGVYAEIEEDKLEKIINNLVYNAIKFNIEGGWVKVEVQCHVTKQQIELKISNSGQGISTNELPHIFDRYYQGGDATAKAKGFGIGLSLVKEFVVAMGGTTAVSSQEGGPTTFTVCLPVSEKNASEELAEELPEPIASWEHFAAKPTILIVEDNTEMRYYLKEILNKRVNIVEVSNGKQALAWMTSNLPELIISDIMMPEMDGKEFLNIVKHNDRLKNIPIITLSALADIENQIGFLRLGIDDYMTKPFDARELSIRAFNLLKNYKERSIHNQSPAEPDDIEPEGNEAEDFRERITQFVIKRIKNTTISVYDLAYEFSLSERQLYRLSKKLTGCSPAYLIKEVRLQRAYELLCSGEITKIEDVANRIGYDTAAYFSKQFFERFGKKATDFL